MHQPRVEVGVGVPGPINRESFFAAQRRHRRRRWQISAVCLLCACIIGIPLSAAITPLIFLIVMIIIEIVNLIVPSSRVILPFVRESMLPVLAQIDRAGSNSPLTLVTAIILAICLIGPGMIAVLILKAKVSAIFKRAGTGGVLWSLGVRDPQMSDFKERQLFNMVAEMALAAGVQTPRVLLIDVAEPNAAVMGASAKDATIVVTRGLLDSCSRSEAQSVVAYLVASVGNGDLKISFTILALFQTLAVVTALLETPFGPKSRAALSQLMQLGSRRRKQQDDSAYEAEQVMRLLTQVLDDKDSDLSAMQSKHGCLSMPLLPLIFTNLTIRMVLLVCMMLLTPLIGLLWKTRCNLADAAAVQLTRDPDALAQFLSRSSGNSGHIPGGERASHLFVVWPTNKDKDTFIGDTLSGSFHPKIQKRLNRLVRLGANISQAEDRRTWQVRGCLGIILLFLAPLVLLIYGLMGMVILMMLGLSFMFTGGYVLAIFVLFTLLQNVMH